MRGSAPCKQNNAGGQIFWDEIPQDNIPQY